MKHNSYKDIINLLTDYFDKANEIYGRQNVYRKDVFTWVKIVYNPHKEMASVLGYIDCRLHYKGAVTEESHAVLNDACELSNLTKDCMPVDFCINEEYWELFVEKLERLFNADRISEYKVNVFGYKF